MADTEWPLLIPLTVEAKHALSSREYAEISRIPFRIGRESRMAMVDGKLLYMERRKADAPLNNDLYLFDQGRFMHISREHLQIEMTADGEFRVYDRGSACGTRVDGHAIGGMDRTGSVSLKNDSEIIIGTEDSPYRFTVRHLERLHTRPVQPER